MARAYRNARSTTYRATYHTNPQTTQHMNEQQVAEYLKGCWGSLRRLMAREAEEDKRALATDTIRLEQHQEGNRWLLTMTAGSISFKTLAQR